MTSYKLPNEFTCPNCGCIMDAAKETSNGRGPQHDDFCVCANCAAFLAYVIEDGFYSLRKCDAADIIIAENDGVYGIILDYQNKIKNGEIKLKVRWPK